MHCSVAVQNQTRWDVHTSKKKSNQSVWIVSFIISMMFWAHTSGSMLTQFSYEWRRISWKWQIPHIDFNAVFVSIINQIYVIRCECAGDCISRLWHGNRTKMMKHVNKQLVLICKKFLFLLLTAPCQIQTKLYGPHSLT